MMEILAVLILFAGVFVGIPVLHVWLVRRVEMAAAARWLRTMEKTMQTGKEARDWYRKQQANLTRTDGDGGG